MYVDTIKISNLSILTKLIIIMENKKKLKRLVLKKEEIVNLNDYQMKEIQGGSSAACAKSILESAVSIYSAVRSIYDLGKEFSYWNCPYSQQETCMTNISNKLVNLPDGSRACEIPEVDIYGMRP